MLKFIACLCFTTMSFVSVQTYASNHSEGSKFRQALTSKIEKIKNGFKSFDDKFKREIKDIAKHDKQHLMGMIKQYEGLFRDLKTDIDEMQVMGAQMASMAGDMGEMSGNMGSMEGSMDKMQVSMDRMTKAMERMEVYMRSIPKMADYMGVMSYAISNTLGRAGNMIPWP